jgi:hypothetical protein
MEEGKTLKRNLDELHGVIAVGLNYQQTNDRWRLPLVLSFVSVVIHSLVWEFYFYRSEHFAPSYRSEL